MILLTDVDDVLLHWAWSFEKWLKLNKNIERNQRLVQVFDLEEWSGMSFPDIWKLVEEYCNDINNYACIPAYTDAQFVLPRLYNKGWKIYAVSAAPNQPSTYSYRKTNLESCFGPIFNEIYLTGSKNDTSKGCKKEILKKFEKTYYVEDSGKQAEKALQVGHNVLLMQRQHNNYINHENCTKVRNWYDIYEIIQEEQ